MTPFLIAIVYKIIKFCGLKPQNYCERVSFAIKFI